MFDKHRFSVVPYAKFCLRGIYFGTVDCFHAVKQIICKFFSSIFFCFAAFFKSFLFLFELFSIAYGIFYVSGDIFCFYLKFFLDTVQRIKPRCLHFCFVSFKIRNEITVIIYVFAVLVLLRLIVADCFKVIEQLCKIICKFIKFHFYTSMFSREFSSLFTNASAFWI